MIEQEIEKTDFYALLVDGAFFGTAKAKTATARAIIKKAKKGTFKITVKSQNGVILPYDQYFKTVLNVQKVLAPLKSVELIDGIEIVIRVDGSGLSSQALATQKAIADALDSIHVAFRATLKPYGFLSKVVKRVFPKKPGLRKSRKREQFSKR